MVHEGIVALMGCRKDDVMSVGAPFMVAVRPLGTAFGALLGSKLSPRTFGLRQ